MTRLFNYASQCETYERMRSIVADKEKSKPVHRIRADSLELAIWRNQGEKGPWFSVTASRSYKQGEEWKQSDSFGYDDLLVLAKLLDMAHT